MNKYQELIDQFKTEVDDRAEEVDPNMECYWQDLTIGWAIGKGLSPKDARDFARYIRYHTELA